MNERYTKKIYVSIKADGRVNSWSATPTEPQAKEVTLRMDHEFFSNPFAYVWQNGQLVLSTAAVKEQQVEAANMVNPAVLIEQQQKVLSLFAQSLPEEKAMEVPDVFPVWQAGQAYTVGQIVRYDKDAAGKSKIFKILQAHTSQADWLPQATPALYKLISFAAGGVPNWVQPVGAVDAYKINDIVMHKSKKWKSTAANNVWEPGVYGWVTIT